MNPSAAPASETTRSRTVTWEDPLASLGSAAGLTGLEYMQAIAEGRIPPPPIAMLMGFGLVEVSEGRAAFSVEPGEHHYNPIGVVHGGVALTLLDSATGCAVHTTLPAGVAYSTLETKLNFARPIKHDTGLVVCEASVVHRGRTVATAEGRVFAQATGKLLAHGTSTCLIIQP